MTHHYIYHCDNCKTCVTGFHSAAAAWCAAARNAPHEKTPWTRPRKSNVPWWKSVRTALREVGSVRHHDRYPLISGLN
jgi:hypothetical protein